MDEGIKHDVSGTAFVVNYSRARMVDISKDIYAELWVTPESMKLWKSLSDHVYPNDDLNLCVRNRFFLDNIEKFINENINPVFLGLASGFDNYPFLVSSDCKFLEFDLPNIIEYKKQKVSQWMKEGKLPFRDVEYIPVDLNDESQRLMMRETMKRAAGNHPTFVTMEGVTYYLQKDTLNSIFSMLKEIQCEGSKIAFDYWKPDAMEYPVMKKLKDFLKTEFGSDGQDWNLFDEEYIRGISGYIIQQSIEIAGLELKYAESRKFQGKDDKIPGNYCVIQRVS